MIYKKLIGEQVSLTPIRMEDAEKWAEWLNDLAVTIPLGSEVHQLITLEGMRQDVEWFNVQKSHVFSIIDNEAEVCIGRCLLFDVNHINRRGMLGLFIGDKEYWNKGYGQETVTLLLDYAFNILNLNSIMLGTASFNTRAINCYKKVGFKEIGRRRQALLMGGKYYDGVMMDLLAEEFEGKLIPKYIDPETGVLRAEGKDA